MSIITENLGVLLQEVYYKKALVFKRTLAETDYSSIRSSALSTGYMALSVIPHSVVIPQVTVRMPQFPNSAALSNYQALSTLGTQQYYSNQNVQQYINNLSTQQYLNNFNNLNNQQYLNNFNTFSNPTFTQSIPQFYNPPPSFNFQPMPQIYIPPPSFNFP
jgi:hypothetical protein